MQAFMSKPPAFDSWLEFNDLYLRIQIYVAMLTFLCTIVGVASYLDSWMRILLDNSKQ